jgi:hypothetical protein
MPMTEHWEWALSHAIGEWIIILGSDDGLMPYFFELAEFLTAEASKNDIKVVNSRRAYFFWNGCDDLFEKLLISYSATASYEMKKTKCQIIYSIIGEQSYVHLPQAYTSSLMHKTLVEEIKHKQQGIFFASLTPDAAAAAAICSTEKFFLETGIPLGWVGTSSKSNGMAYSRYRSTYQEEHKNEALINMYSTKIHWNNLMGEFCKNSERAIINNHKAYFYESILQTHRLQSSFWKAVYNSKLFKLLVFSRILYEIKNNKDKTDIENLKFIASKNDISFKYICFCERHIIPIISRYYKNRQLKVDKENSRLQNISCFLNREEGTDLSLMDAYKIIYNLNIENNFIKNFISRSTN